jgi:hypothetical protein
VATDEDITRKDIARRSRTLAALTVATAVAAVAAAVGVDRAMGPQASGWGKMVEIELGGRGQRLPFPDGTTTALWWDLLVIGGYGIALLLGVRLLARLLPESKWRLRSFAYTAVMVTVGADLFENTFLLLAGEVHSMPPSLRGAVLDAAAAASVVKFSAAVPAVALALGGLGLTSVRLFRPRGAPYELDVRRALPIDGDPDVADPAWPAETADHRTRWRNAYNVPGSERVDDLHRRDEEVVGICLSGGGIRSASVALGALQTMGPQLRGAQFLVSVSGGGFTAGAFQQALTAACDPATPLPGEVQRNPENAFRQGGVEEDHVRRHSSYVADSAGRLAAALAMMLRHLVLSLALLFGPAVVAGVLAGWFYSAIPLAGDPASPTPASRGGPLAALAVVTAAATVFMLLGQWAAAHTGATAWRVRATGAARNTGLLAGTVAAVTVVIPALAWITVHLRDTIHVSTGITIGGPVFGVILTYLASLAAIAWRGRAKVAGVATGLFNRTKPAGVSAAIPDGMLQHSLVMITLVVLGAVWLLLFAGMMLTAGHDTAMPAAVVAAVVVVLGGIVDETTLSLHPFYRRRLASAFAVRAVRQKESGRVVAVPYEQAERTTLSRYGRVDAETDFPQVVFAAAANLTGEDRTPSGRNAVSYTFSSDWVGGPDLGWVKTEDLERISPPRLQRDLTVQGAVAISGAAFASAMGRGATFIQVLLAVTGARLGAWMPNPRFVIDTYTHERDWDQRRLPRVRRLSYLLRELFDVHPHEAPLVQVTDGGHYENLGLVELFRRRCTRIYCIDASGDSPPTATTLANALTLAEQELGVTVTPADPWPNEPGSNNLVDPKGALRTLSPRLSTTPLIVGTYTYPDAAGLVGGDRTGQLIFAKAMLWPELPYSLLSFAAKHPIFPHDSTGDQWFDDAHFAAYTELGRQLGHAAKGVAPRRPTALGAPSPSRVDAAPGSVGARVAG